MLARAEPSADEVEAMFREDAQFEAEIAELKAQIAALWVERAPVHARLVEYKRRCREERLGAAMLEKIRRVGEPTSDYRRT
jgi:hypothetical protein